MKLYIQSMAKIFHGFRIDNAHSTPINVGEYFLRKARIVNPNLIIFGELFTGDPVKDALFVKRWSLNSIVKELIWNFESYHIYKLMEWVFMGPKNYINSLPPME